MAGSAIELAEVAHRFGDVRAVDDLSFAVGSGETVALLGANGAGKTTALKVALGLIRPDAGSVRVLGEPPEDAIGHGRVGAMLQESALPAGARVGELIDLVRRFYPRPLSLRDVLRLVGLGSIAKRRVDRLSGGQRRRVRLALALAGHPELLVLDEPTAAMDAAARRSFWMAVRGYAAEARTLLFATHRLEEAERVADRVLVIAAGRLVADGSPQEVKGQAAGAGRLALPSLEEAFLALTGEASGQ